MNKLNYLIIILPFLIIISCSQDDENIVAVVQKAPELIFTFEDSVYTINSLVLERFIDTLNYDINEPLLLLNEFFSIEGRINETQDFTAYIINAIVEPSDCIPATTYYEDYEVQEIENQCIYFTPTDEPWCEKSHCNKASISLRTIHNDTTTSISISNEGYLIVQQCENDTISGIFESKHFKNGSFQNIPVN